MLSVSFSSMSLPRLSYLRDTVIPPPLSLITAPVDEYEYALRWVVFPALVAVSEVTFQRALYA